MPDDSYEGGHPLTVEFGQLLRYFRRREGLTQEQLALAVFGNQRKATIAELENDLNRIPYPNTIARICDALSLSFDDRARLADADRRRRLERAKSSTDLKSRFPARNDVLVGDGATPRSLPPPTTDRVQQQRPGKGVVGRLTGELPKFSTRFIGRDAPVNDVRQLMLDPCGPRLVSLVGPGGSGKTRLAVEIGHAVAPDFDNDVAFVPLDGVELVEDVVPQILGVLGIANAPTRTSLQNLSLGLADRRTLLVLDNLEQVRAIAGDLAHLLTMNHHLVLLSTTRVALNITGEHQVGVTPLGLPPQTSVGIEAIAESPAVQLFAARAATRRRFELTEANAAATAALCCRLDGLPLALELAAGRTNLLAVEEILDRLSVRGPLLDRGPQDLPLRQRSLQDTLDWSLRLLLDDEVRAFREPKRCVTRVSC